MVDHMIAMPPRRRAVGGAASAATAASDGARNCSGYARACARCALVVALALLAAGLTPSHASSRATWATRAQPPSGPTPFAAWFAGSRVTGDWLNNATHASAAGYRQIAGAGLCGLAEFGAVPGGPWYNESGMRFVRTSRQRVADQLAAAEAEGMQLWATYEALCFPASLVAAYANEMVDRNQTQCVGYHKAAQGCISFARPRTRAVFAALIDEVFTLFPHLDGVVFRWGENSPCAYNIGNAPFDPSHPIDSLAAFINELRTELCVARNKTVVFRTWDTSTSAFHANRTFYEAVVAQVQPHPRLVFSIKHTQLDFWRRTNPNPCIGAGSHRQVVEACVGNLFQGMGAYPSYDASGVIDGFPETDPALRRGLRDYVSQPTFAGVFPVTQGSFGYPAAKQLPSPAAPTACEDCAGGVVPFPWVWPALELQVLAQWSKDVSQGEADAFAAVVRRTWGLSDADIDTLHAALLLAMQANLGIETVGSFDAAVTQGVVRPSGNLMIHNSYGGVYAVGNDGHCNAGPGAPGSGVANACEVLPWLLAHGGNDASRAEKAAAVDAATEAQAMLASIPTAPSVLTPHGSLMHRAALATAEYAVALFRAIESAWSVLLEGYAASAGAPFNRTRLCGDADAYAQALAAYQALWNTTSPPTLVPSLYNLDEWAYDLGAGKGIGSDVSAMQAAHCSRLPGRA